MLLRVERGRFTTEERVVHWATATLVLTCIATAACLYFAPLATLVGRRETVKTLHVLAGLLSLVPFVSGLMASAALRADVRRLDRWGSDTKFNRGQQLNAALSLGSVLLLLASGSIMFWFDPFPLSWRTGATFVHDWVAVGFGLLVIGHVYKALTTRS